ncbi:MAG: SAM-dependent methyltransferase [Muribaculaceae bacterium]|nr:SAM-dependent methyltransferase [Muribaculaceae bacterium]
MADAVKHSGQVFTPAYLVDFILDEAGYRGEAVLGRHCIDNSCGDGAFLCRVVERYCAAYRSRKGTLDGVGRELEHYIHGIELDPEAYSNCLAKLAACCAALGIAPVHFDVCCTDALAVTRFDGRMDFVVGNPPYVRVHNLDASFEAVKRFRFGTGGMTDLYLVFYEIGLRMLAPGGTLCYIAPGSWTSSLAGSRMREYIVEHRNLVSVIDLGHFQPFKATTYTMIALFRKGRRADAFDCHRYLPDSSGKALVGRIPFEAEAVKAGFILADTITRENMRRMAMAAVPRAAVVKNGFATLADSVFIGSDLPFDDFTIPVLKASTGRWSRAFYPYDAAGDPLPDSEVFAEPAVAAYLEAHKSMLLKGCTEAEAGRWHLYGRTQALRDVCRPKIAVNTCVRDVASIKLSAVPAGSGVYSGLYILTDEPFGSIASIILSDDFIAYVAALKKYKSGGYYTFSSKDLELYINYMLAKRNMTADGAL